MTRENATPNRLFLWMFAGLAVVVIAWSVINAVGPDPLPREAVEGRYFFSRTLTDPAELDKIVAYVWAEYEARQRGGAGRFLPTVSREEVKQQVEAARATGKARVSIDLRLASDGTFSHEAYVVMGRLDASKTESGDWGTTPTGFYLHDPLSGTKYDVRDGVLTYRYHGLTLELERKPLDAPPQK